MEYEDEEQKGGLLQRIQESPRTVSALIIILIVAAAIYAFSGDEIDPTQPIANNDTNVEDVVDDEEEDATEDEEDTDEEENGTGDDTEENENGDVEGDSDEPTPTPTDSDEEAEEEELPEATRTDQGFVEVAQSGEGITHLARKATTRWLSENSPEYTVTAEHRVYIEDYIQNRISSERLSLGETRTISFELMQEAVAAAGQLNDQQLENLSQYTSAL